MIRSHKQDCCRAFSNGRCFLHALPAAQRRRKDMVIVLSMMNPNLTVSTGTAGGPLALPTGVTDGRKTTQGIFYDPITSTKSSDVTPTSSLPALSRATSPRNHQRKLQDSKQAHRASALGAVDLDLAMLPLNTDPTPRSIATVQTKRC